MLNKLRNFLVENDIDYLLVNTTDEFLVEYNELSNCARYFVTGFTGSTGDVLVSKDCVYQFVDGRYHEQADAEVDHKTVQVVKLQQGQSFLEELVSKIKPSSILGVVSKKIPLNFYKILKSKLSKKHCRVKTFDFDPVDKFHPLKTGLQAGITNKGAINCTLQSEGKPEKVKPVCLEIAGVSADEKFKKIVKKLRQKAVTAKQSSERKPDDTARCKAQSFAYVDTHLENIAYLTNCRQYKTPFSSVFKAKMVIYKDKAVIFSDETFENKIGKHFEIRPLKEFDSAFKNVNTIIYNPSTINCYDFKLIKSKAQEAKTDFIKEMKAIKNDCEIAHFKKNFSRTDNVVNHASHLVQTTADLSEKQLSEEVEKEYLKQGARQLSFKTILAAGANSSVIHYSHPSENVKIKDGDFVLLDCGAHFEGGYSTDITRTFVKGEPSALQKKVYTTVLKMFLHAYHYRVTPKTTGFTLDRVARKIHKQSGLKDFNFNHGLGHGVGINVHENPPTISCGATGKRVLKKNMVFTIEPGLYKPGFGGVRLENTVFLTENNKALKIESLSHVPFQENAIDYTLLNEQEKHWLKSWQSQGKNND